MDDELLMALILLWISTTTAIVVFFMLWFGNDRESFHPHQVDVDNRHNLFLVVSSNTKCKHDFAVKSISSFVAPRGASSSKWFTAIIIIMCIAGMFGSFRWYRVGDANPLEAGLALTGFAMLILLTAFESDVSSDRFLEDKLLVTSWFLESMGADKVLPFALTPSSEAYRLFLRESGDLYQLYEEDHQYNTQGIVPPLLPGWPYHPWWCSLHIIGAVVYVSFVPIAVILHDLADESIANGIISALSFLVFCLMGYLTGAYMPVIKPLRCIILAWNPFLRDEEFFHSLRQAAIKYLKRRYEMVASDQPTSARYERLRRRRLSRGRGGVAESDASPQQRTIEQAIQKLETFDVASVIEANAFLWYAREYPLAYLQVIGHALVMTEMIAVLTPAVAIGLQWITALCPGTVSESIFGLFGMAYACVMTEICLADKHCLFEGGELIGVPLEL